MRRLSFTLSFALLSGCVAGFDLTTEELPSANLSQLCGAITAGRLAGDQGLVQRGSGELKRRNTFTATELSAIVRGVAAPGMSEAAGLCAWGYYWNDVNTTTTSGGVSKQYVFGDGKFIERRYLYTRNGRVTGTQE